MISACVVPTMKYEGGGVMVWGCFSGDTISDLFRIQGTLNQHGYHSILQRYAIPSGLHLVGLSFVFQQDNDPKHTSRLCKSYLTRRRVMECCIRSPDLNQSEGEAANKCSAYVRTPSRLLEKHSRCSWLRKCQECGKLSSRQRVATLKNLKYKIDFELFKLFWLLYDSICVILVLMSSLFINNVENSKNKEKPLK